MVNTIVQCEEWIFLFSLEKLSDKEILFLSKKPIEMEICECLKVFIDILNQRKASDFCFMYPDLGGIKNENNCTIDLPLPTERVFTLGIGVNV